jgi:hypothetical protein
MSTSIYVLQGAVDDFGNLIRACDLPAEVYMQRYNYFKDTQ